MLKCSTSLWSADLTNLGAEMKRVEPYSERFHLDVADGHYVPTLLFFPDLVNALRPQTREHVAHRQRPMVPKHLEHRPLGSGEGSETQWKAAICRSQQARSLRPELQRLRVAAVDHVDLAAVLVHLGEDGGDELLLAQLPIQRGFDPDSD